MVGAGLESHESGGSASICSGLLEGNNLGVVVEFVLMEAFADDGAILYQDAADGGIRRGQTDAAASERESLPHELPIACFRVR